MGVVYRHALIIFTAIAVAEQLIGYVLGLMAPLKFLFGPLVKTYSALAIGCTLGLAVFKRAPELELS